MFRDGTSKICTNFDDFVSCILSLMSKLFKQKEYHSYGKSHKNEIEIKEEKSNFISSVGFDTCKEHPKWVEVSNGPSGQIWVCPDGLFFWHFGRSPNNSIIK